MLVFDNELQDISFPPIFILWGFGVINLITNAIYVDKAKFRIWVLLLLVTSGSTWVFPPLLFTYFGIPFLFVYLIVSIYVHFKKVFKQQFKS
ncbi:hypothetical protein POKO110462_05410 [Pontibacter korlensis]